MPIELLAYTRPNPALNPAELAGVGDLATIWQGQSTYQENIIEFAGRVCYRSTQRMGTAPNFISARVREGHEDIIEHIVITLRVRGSDDPLRWRMLNRHCEVTQEADGSWVVSGNTRVWLDFLRRGIGTEALPFLYALAPSVYAEFADKAETVTITPPNAESSVDLAALRPAERDGMRVTLLGYTQPMLGDTESRTHHGSATFLFEGISRACTHQLVRHRLASFSQESQRYVQYEALEPDIAPSVPRLPEPQQAKRHGLCIFSLDQEEFIIKLYLDDGFSAEAISEAYDVHPTTIRDIVMRSGAEFRDRRASRTMYIRTDFFDQIGTPLKAQILGLIYADGNVAQRDGVISHASIAQHSNYKAWLKRLGALWGGSVISGGRDGSSKLTIPGTELAEALVQHGVMPAKSKVLKPPSLPDELIPHFIRGYMEGDGYISKQSSQPRIVILGTPELLKWMHRAICDGLNWNQNQTLRRRSDHLYELSIGGRFQVPDLLEWLYSDFELRYAHPGKLKSAAAWSPRIQTDFQNQLAGWAGSLGVILPPKFDPASASIG
ncbi:MAG TPA: FAD-dependent thymidylate synthase, partial [Caldilineaceae bacterium]|nr:FAD-dependent thymidylate synthase [Caldilineaceae bacterium]